MAKQNFLSGGYYGKLGQTVGQRWKNIRTIRTYVIPRNPRTPVQQANRGKFGDCVFYAQVGMQLNYNAPCFVASDKTAWNYRMSTARALQDLGLSELERFPLYPINFSLPYQITAAQVTEVIDGTHIKVTVDGTIPQAERVLTMLLLLPGTEDFKERLAVCVGANSSEDYAVFTFQLPDDLVLSNGMKCRFISCDDVDSTTDLIASSQINLPIGGVITREFDTSIRSVTRSGNVFTFTFNEAWQSGEATFGTVSFSCVANGAVVTRTIANPTFINNGGYFALSFTSSATNNQFLEALPAGSSLSISSLSFYNSSYLLTADNVNVSIENQSDLSRVITSNPTKTTVNQVPIFSWNFDGEFTAKTETAACSGVDNRLITPSDFSRSGTWSANGTSISYQWSDTEKIPCLQGSKITVANGFTAVANGVSYTVGINEFAFTNIATIAYQSTPYVEGSGNLLYSEGLDLYFTIENQFEYSNLIESLSASFANTFTFDSAPYQPSFIPQNLNSITVIDEYETRIEINGVGSFGGATSDYMSKYSTQNGTITLLDSSGCQWVFNAVSAVDVYVEV